MVSGVNGPVGRHAQPHVMVNVPDGEIACIQLTKLCGTVRANPTRMDVHMKLKYAGTW